MSRTDYDLTRIKALAFDVDGVLSPSIMPMAMDGTPLRMVNVKDGYALQLANKLGYKIAIITGADSPAVKARFEGLGITDVFTSVSVKMPVLQQWMTRHNLHPEQVVYAGDDIPDYEAMKSVGLAVAPADAASDIRNIARYITPCKGGEGVARDIIEQILRANGQWLNNDTAFDW